MLNQFRVPADLTAYASLSDLKAHLSITDQTDDPQLLSALDSASVLISQQCQRRFDKSSAAEVRYYAMPNRVNWNTVIDVTDVADTSTAVVAVDVNAAGTYPETWTENSQFLWLPYNANPDGWPATHMQFNDLYSWVPLAFLYAQRTNSPRIKVTATVGFPAVPAAINEAALIVAASIFRRKDSPDGVAGSSEWGVIRVSKYMDPTAASLIRPYAKDSPDGFA